MEREAFLALLNKLEPSNILVVTKLDLLGRNAMEVRATVDRLAVQGVRVHCLALGGADLTSPAGKMTMGVIATVAEFESDLLIERTQSGLARAKSQGKTLGRPQSLGAGIWHQSAVHHANPSGQFSRNTNRKGGQQMTIQFIAPPLTHGRKVIAKTTRFWVIKVEPTDEFHNRLDGWDYVVYDKRANHQCVVADAKLEKGAFHGVLFVNAQHAWPVEGETAKDLISSTRSAMDRAERFYS